MSKQNQTEWCCPYCDGLNDWQDEVCQICGDGRREEAVSQTETKNVSSEAQRSRMEYQTQSQNTYSQQTTKKKTEPEVRRPEPEIRKTETEVKTPVSEVLGYEYYTDTEHGVLALVQEIQQSMSW